MHPYEISTTLRTRGKEQSIKLNYGSLYSVVEALQKERIVDVPLPVQNRPGASGADFLATMVEQYRGSDSQVSVTSLSMMMNQLRGKSKYGYHDVTMIARLMTEYFVVVTGPRSPLTNLGDLVAAIKTNPAAVKVGAAQPQCRRHLRW